MLARFNEQKRAWLFWGVLLSAAVIILWLAPEEQTLGQGIRSVYVHVALIWAGLAGLVIAGLLGLLLAATGSRRILAWLQVIGWVGLAFYAAGVGMSIVSSKVNWGNVFWQEPRMQVALNMLAVATLVQLAIAWLPWVRLRGVLAAGLIIVLAWSTLNAPLVLHPRNPIGSSSSSTIQLTFSALTLLSVLSAAWIVRFWQRRAAQE
ncbi:MAG: hypothetical protein ACE5E7_00715 [Anaerolineae bacterium]